jgi:dihydroneopterin aldolase
VAAVGVQIERTASPLSAAGRSATVVQLLGSGLVPGTPPR